MRKRAKELARQLDSGYMELGEVLWKVFDTPKLGRHEEGPIFTDWGYKTFGQWAEEELGLQRRKAERLRRIWYCLEVELTGMDKLVKKRLVDLGWSKLRELVPVLSEGNAEEWAVLAEKLNYPNLCAAISAYKRKVDAARALDGEVTDPVSELPGVDATIDPDGFEVKDKHFYNLRRSEAEVLEQALDRAAAITHKNNPSWNLGMICTDFLATNDFRKSDDPENLGRYISRLEESMGLKFIVADPATNRVIYGLATLEQLAKGERE